MQVIRQILALIVANCLYFGLMRCCSSYSMLAASYLTGNPVFLKQKKYSCATRQVLSISQFCTLSKNALKRRRCTFLNNASLLGLPLALLNLSACIVMQTIIPNQHNACNKLCMICLLSTRIYFSSRHTLRIHCRANLRLSTIAILMNLSPIAVVLATDYFSFSSGKIEKINLFIEIFILESLIVLPIFKIF